MLEAVKGSRSRKNKCPRVDESTGAEVGRNFCFAIEVFSFLETGFSWLIVWGLGTLFVLFFYEVGVMTV